MPRRVAARLITGPLAFLLGGLIDLTTFAFSALRARARRPRTGDWQGVGREPGDVRADQSGTRRWD